MKISTKNFGELDVLDKDIITFDTPLSGLPNSNRYVLISKDEDNLFFWLQSVDEPELSICIIDMFKIMPEYDPKVSEIQVMALGESTYENIRTYNTLVVPEDIEQTRANLLAPIVININTMKAAQIIATNDDYDIAFKIFEKLDVRKDV